MPQPMLNVLENSTLNIPDINKPLPIGIAVCVVSSLFVCTPCILVHVQCACVCIDRHAQRFVVTHDR